MEKFDKAQALNLAIRSAGPREVSEDEGDLLYGSPTFVGLPDGRGSHLIHVLDGCWLTQRTRHRTGDRGELWVTSALAPLVTTLVQRPLPLVSGGHLEMAAFLHPALVGPAGWLPDVPAGGLVGLRLRSGAVEVAAVEATAQSLEEQQRVRELLARHLRRSQDWYDDGQENNKRHALTEAIASAVLEEPTLLRDPLLPLDELLHDPLQDQQRHHWRDAAAAWQECSVSFSIGDMPEGLYNELTRRATVYGMAFDQFVIALLGHLAWRTPFAEDIQPFEQWLPEDPDCPPPSRLRSI